MSSIEEIRAQLRKGRIAEVEEAFLTHLEESPDDIGLFTAAARGLVGSGEDDRAVLLLELLDEKLAAAGLDEHRLTLLRETGAVRCSAADEHALMLDLIRRLYSESTSVDGLTETVGLHRAVEDRKKNWDKIDRLRSLLGYDLGAIVMMEGRGVGEVVEVNIALKKFKVDFHGHGGLRVGFAAAAKLLTPLGSDHILWRKLDDIEALKSLAKSDPSELLRQVLASYEKPLTGTEIKQVLSGVVTVSGWTSWWGTARKHPQVVVHSGGRPAYSWAATAGDALSGLSARFSAADLAGKVDIYKQAAGRDADLKQRMGSELAARSNLLRENDPPTALALYCILERTGGPLEKVQWNLMDLVPDAKTAVALLSKVKDRQHREVFLTMIAEKSEDRIEIFANYLPVEEIPKILDLVAERLRDEAPDRFKRVISSVLSQPQTSPAAFVWLAERAGRDDEIRESLSFRLLQQLLRAISLEALRPYRARMVKLFESGGTVPRLLPLLNRETAAKAEEAIGRCGALEEFYRAPLVTAIHVRFPDLREGEQETIYALPTSITARRAQLKELLEEEIPANRRAIEVAREMGDLRENFEYKAARQRHEYLAARASGLNGELERARPVYLTSVDTSEVRIGCTVSLEDDAGPRRITILGPWESQPTDGIISYESDLGRKLLGNAVGATLDLGNGEATIAKIVAWEPSDPV